MASYFVNTKAIEVFVIPTGVYDVETYMINIWIKEEQNKIKKQIRL